VKGVEKRPLRRTLTETILTRHIAYAIPKYGIGYHEHPTPIAVTNSQMPGGRAAHLPLLPSLLRPMTVDTKAIYSTEIRNRPPRTWRQVVHAIAYLFISNLGCIVYNASQFIFLLPLCLIPLASARSLYHAGIRLSEGTLATLLGTCFPSILDGFH
jgi:hypothetical protein